MAENLNDSFFIRTENRPCRLLVVDDEPDICLGLASLMRLKGCYAREATSGLAALEYLQADSFDVMILDMQMPNMSGVEVLAEVGQRYPGLVVIILTGHKVLDNAIAAAKSEQVVDYLLKPASHQEIIEAVLRAINKYNRRYQQRQLDLAAQQFFEVLSHSSLSTNPDNADTRGAALAANHELPEALLQVPPLSLDRRQRLVTWQNHPQQTIELTEGESKVLASLMAQPNQIHSCQDIVRAVWGYDTDETEAASIVRPYISRMRRKFAAVNNNQPLIRTVRGCGYIFTATEE